MAVKKKTTAPVSARISDKDEKLKALSVTMEHLEKDFGSGAVMRLGADSIQDVETISTGSLGLDYALGVGGLPRGRITEIYGPESSGKTTLAIHVIAEAQKQGGRRSRGQGKSAQGQPRQEKPQRPPQPQKQAQPKPSPQQDGQPAQAGGQNHKRRYRPHHRRKPGGGQGGAQPPQA